MIFVIKNNPIIKIWGLIILIFIFSAQTNLPQSETNDINKNISYGSNLLSHNYVLKAEKTNHFTFVKPPASFRNNMQLNKAQSSTINVVYNGFSTEAQTAFQYAVDILETEITSSVQIEIVATWEPLATGVLGSAGPVNFFRNISNEPVANSWYPVALANKLAGSDLDTDNPDISASFNSDFSSWYFGTDGNTPIGEYDFVSVVMHEIIHGLGFVGSMQVTVNSGAWGYNTGYPLIYDRFTVNGSDQLLISSFTNPSVALGDQLKSGDLFFNGSSAVIAEGGTNPKLYAPASWEAGSSYSHWDEDTYPAGNINSLMTPALGGAEAIHNPGFITRGLLQDIGWTIDQPLPVELSSFIVLVSDSYIELKWATETEVNNYGFEIQRKTINDEWKTIGFVNGNGNSNSPKKYSFIDNNFINGNSVQYRLKQIDNDGRYELSDEILTEYIPSEFALYQNYPNPFNPTTMIRYQIPETQKVIVKVFNTLGAEVAELVNGTQEAGRYEINFDGRNLASGTYIYRIVTGDFTQTKKMILLK